jgi:DNA invertase Pin-like site-specific DNA recombinase
MNELLAGYERVSTEQQDLTAQRNGLHALGLRDDRTYVDHGLAAPNRDRPDFGWLSPHVEQVTPWS